VNFYDELGVARSASTDEIRQAYKALARLVHPDLCADERLRSLAEIQMKRLNQIVAVLADPEARRRYDAELEAQPLVPIRERANQPRHVLIWEQAGTWLPRNATAWVWILAAVIGITGLMLLLPRDVVQTVPLPPEAAQAQASRSPKPTAKPGVKDPQPAGESGAALLAELRATRRELEELRQEQAREPEPDRQTAPRRSPIPSKPAPSKAAAQMPEPPSYVVPPTTLPTLALPPEPPAPEVRAAKQPVRRFDGHWFYVRSSPQPKTNGLYPPEYIELRLTEDSGRVRGRYQARYHVTDQAISPEVAFEFEGPSNLPSVQLPWKGPGGAAGEITLKLVSDTSIEVNWKAYRLSDQLGLMAGTAMLVREQVRE
jgi:hypothetical protein